MKKILVPIDFSKPSEYAAKMAAKIAEKTSASIYLIHLIELPTGVIDMGSGSKFSIPESMLYLRKTKEKIVAFKNTFFTDEMNVEYFIKLSNPFDGIKKYAEKINADLIIMGSKGHSEFEEIMIGSNTEKVVRSSKTPVIVVKKDDAKIKLKNLVFASNFKEENKEVFSKFLNFANAFNSKIHLLKINTPSQFESTFNAKEKVKTFIKDYNLPKHTINIYNDVSVEKGILNYAKEKKADLIALSTHGRSGISHLFTGSVTKNLSKKALKPMFTVKV
ncbi:universal stress protein [Polaribacter sp. KT 15]|uniref:universal stress protein n=1 Tax=Polaribacter sp. KT 15 TaxID=1896175 RepID=UPI00090B5416|nr:universal stress protein [Polaribacter sp. KT 15]SHM85284.1 Nucleotide-binding universal stress protein, UspA family [Polaribacter sp. KT 15]